ncbi:MAG: response regulator transcription factor [Paludibacteraceae bacterium]|nr:response regulator transcription factor [Paludibacteraceae bacterium]
MSTKILVIDGDISLSTVLNDYLCSRGYKARAVGDGKAALDLLAAEHWNLVLMEIQGIGMNGFELLKDIRHRLPQIPLIVLTTRSDRENQMRAFQLGCDDYQTKPFSMDILICRMEAILRRVRAFEESKQKVFDLNGHTFDATHQTFDGRHMSSRESDLLLMLCRAESEVVDKHRILSALWKEDNAFTARSLGVYINHLRAYLTPVDYEIIAVRFKGYKLVNHKSQI